MASLGEEYPKQQARCRTILGHLKELGPAGKFGAVIIEELLKRADKASIEQDTIGMIGIFEEMKACKE